MARPTTRSVVREEIAALTPALAEAIAKILGAQPSTVAARTVAPPNMAPGRRVQPERNSVKTREKVAKMPEGGYADRVVVVPSDRGDQPRPKNFRKWDAATREAFEAKLARSYNVYFYRSSDEQNCKPHPQHTDALKAAGFGFVMDRKEPSLTRWYGERSKLPAAYRNAIEL